MYEEKTERDELKLMIDFIPEEKLGEAIILIDNLLEFNDEVKRDMLEVEEGKNLLGPFKDGREMVEAMLRDDEEEIYSKNVVSL